ncbi:MAG: PRC-barrel domain-containing protein [Vicinamibacterales bacterium]|nr:PRC-barrel domain-containing protein [Vicinamibacterales bacterium]
MDPNESHLRYIDASSVDTPLGHLNEMTLVSPTNGDVGKLDGMLFDPWERHVCYFVVESRHWFDTRRYLLPASPTRIESDRKALRVDIEPDGLSALPQVNPDVYPRMSDDDLISALFTPRAA